MGNEDDFHVKLNNKIDEYVHLVYHLSKVFPREERYGVTSQLRRAALSVMLNYIEGYARMREKVDKHFLQISYASLKESLYVLKFSKDENYIEQENDLKRCLSLGDEIGAMLYTTINNI